MIVIYYITDVSFKCKREKYFFKCLKNKNN